jgi:hypothetical protein
MYRVSSSDFLHHASPKKRACGHAFAPGAAKGQGYREQRTLSATFARGDFDAAMDYAVLATECCINAVSIGCDGAFGKPARLRSSPKNKAMMQLSIVGLKAILIAHSFRCMGMRVREVGFACVFIHYSKIMRSMKNGALSMSNE